MSKRRKPRPTTEAAGVRATRGDDEGQPDDDDGLFDRLVERLSRDVATRVDKGRTALAGAATAYVDGKVGFQDFAAETEPLISRLEQDEADLSNLAAIRKNPAEVWQGFQTPLIDALRRLSGPKSAAPE